MVHPDLARPIDWVPLLRNVDAIVHLAATGTPPLERINHPATAELAKAASKANISRLLYVSSIRAAVGLATDHLVTEEDEPRPVDDYGRSKLAAETAVRSAGVAFTVLRPVAVYASGMRGNVGMPARLACLPIPPTFASFANKRSILSIDNLASAIVFALSSPSTRDQTYNVADPNPVTIPEIIAALRRGLGRRLMLLPIPPPLVQPLARALGGNDLWSRLSGELVVSCGKLQAAGWCPETETAEALARLVQLGEPRGPAFSAPLGFSRSALQQAWSQR